MKKKNVRWLLALLMCIVVLSGCGAKSEGAAYDSYYEMPAEEAVVEEEAMESTAEMGEVVDTSRKLIKRYYLNMETLEYDSLVSYIQEATAASGGYIESSNMSGTSLEGYGDRYAYFILRIPVKDAESFIRQLEDNGHVTNKTENVEDITLSYVDTESRIESLRVEQETLLEMLSEAEDLESILVIQERLTDIRYELQSYESQIRSYDNLIEYTTISVDVYEVKRETPVVENPTFWGRVRDGLSENLYNFGQGAQDVLIWFIVMIPYWLLLGVIAVIVIVIVRISHKKNLNRDKKVKEKKRKKDKNETNELQETKEKEQDTNA